MLLSGGDDHQGVLLTGGHTNAHIPGSALLVLRSLMSWHQSGCSGVAAWRSALLPRSRCKNAACVSRTKALGCASMLDLLICRLDQPA
eukprot:361485-Chlamydomonas_euryale.AAC.5